MPVTLRLATVDRLSSWADPENCKRPWRTSRGVLSGGSAGFIDQIPGQQRLVALSGIGERFPLHCTANGKAILACFDPNNAARVETTKRCFVARYDQSLVLSQLGPGSSGDGDRRASENCDWLMLQ